MSRKRLITKRASEPATVGEYGGLVSEISGLLEQARRGAARSVNAILTATYWEIGRRIVEHEQGGKARAEYGEELLVRLSEDLTGRFGRGFSRVNLQQMRLFSMDWEICQTPSDKFVARVKLPAGLLEKLDGNLPTPSGVFDIRQTPSAKLMTTAFPLAWSQYAMGGIKANVFASRYLTALPAPETLRQEIVTTQHALETRAAMKRPSDG